MKKEANKKSKLWLWLVIGAVALAAVAGTVLALVLGGERETAPVGRPELYWNVDKAAYTPSDASGVSLSTREPAEDGLYHIRFAYEGQLQEYTVADKRLVNYIDTFSCVGLVFDDEGMIVDAIDARDLATEIGREVYVRYYRNDTLYVNTSIAMNGMTMMLDVTDMTRIYNVSEGAEPLGGQITPEDLQPMDCVTIYGNALEQTTHVFLQSKPEKSPVYWRVQSMYSSADQGTARIPDETGAYSIDFFCDGQVVTLKCRDKKIVDYVDYKSDYKAHFGFIFDEEGYIVKRVESQIGIQARCVGEGYDVTAIDDVEIELTSQIWSNAGDMEGFKLEDDTVIYDVSKAAYAEGRQGQQVDSLQLGDRVVVWLDTENDAVLVYVTERLVDSPMYFNVTRKYSSSRKESTRTPNADGWYEVELAVNGEVRTFKTKDKAKIDYLDSFSPRGLGLKVENGNEIVYVYHANCVYGQKYFCDGRYVTNISGTILELWSRPQNQTYNCILSPDHKVYDMSGVGPLGSETTLQKGDNVLAYRTPTGELICLYVMRRAVEDAQLYWNLGRKYDTTTKQTTRIPDENGWYVFNMAVGGKTVTVKTKSRAMATKVDSFSPGAVGMIVEGGIIQAAFDPKNVEGGNQLTSATYVSKINSDGTAQTYSLSKKTYTDFTLAEDCKIYNVSAAYLKEKGEITTLKLGDMVTVYANIKNEAAVIFVRNRDVDAMYWKQDRFYDSTNEVTTRVPDAEGWYVYDLAVNGTVKTVKTKDIEIANKMDLTESGFGLILNGDEVIRYVSAAYVKDVSTDGVVNWDVVSVNGSRVELKYNRPGSDNTGKTMTITLAPGAKIMDVSPNAVSFGAYTTLQPGDRIRSYINADEQHLYVWIKYRATREKGVESYCEHCGQTVFWNPYVGSVPKGDGHYYLVEDTVTTSQTTVGSDELDYEVVIDLNGKILTKEKGRALLAYKGDDLVIMDSVGGGEIRAAGSSAGNGGVLLVTEGSHFTLMGGTLRYIPGETVPGYGGVVAVTGQDSVFTMEGGKITDGRVALKEGITRTIGGNIYCYKATVNITGGTVENGQAMRGGNLYLAADSVLSMTGGEITGGVAEQNGGNIFASSNVRITATGGTLARGEAVGYGGNLYLYEAAAELGAAIDAGKAKYGANVGMTDSRLTVSGGSLTDGAAGLYGGNLYVTGASEMNITGGKISGGTAGDYAGNIYLTTSTTCKMHISGGEIAGDVRINGAGQVMVSGAPKLTVGPEGGLDMRNGVLLTLGQLTEGADIAISNTGAFTEATENAESYVPYFHTAKEGGTVYAQDRVLHTVFGTIRFAECVHCGKNVPWTQWENTANPASGHYFLAEDVNMGRVRVNIGSADSQETEVILDLNGKTWTTDGNRAFWVYGYLAVMDTVGGGEIAATGSDMGSGGVMRVPGKLELYSGTIRRQTAAQLVGKGGVLQLTSGAEFTMKGGKLTGGTCVKYTDSANKTVDAQGGSIYAEEATVTVEGGIIEGGSAATGGNLYLTGSSFTMTGGVITGGTATGSGGNIYLLRSTFLMDEGLIENGLSGNRGGNILIEQESDFTVNGGIIRGGQAAKQGGNIRLNYSTSSVTLGGGTIYGDMTVFSAKSFTLSGSPKILMGNSAGLILGEGIDASAGNESLKLTLSGLNTDAEIYISAVGPITDAPAAEYLNCFKGALRTQLAINAEGILEATQGTTGFCPHCWQTGEPASWTDAAQIPTTGTGTYTRLSEDAHYYLTGNITRSGSASRLNIGGTSATGVDIVIDLAGHNWTVTDNRVAQVFAQLTVMDSLCSGIMQGGTKGTAEPYSTVITVNHKDASLTLYSGTLKAAATDECAINCNKGVFRMYGGYVIGAEAATKPTVVLGTAGQLDRSGGILDGKRKEETD